MLSKGVSFEPFNTTTQRGTRHGGTDLQPVPLTLYNTCMHAVFPDLGFGLGEERRGGKRREGREEGGKDNTCTSLKHCNMLTFLHRSARKRTQLRNCLNDSNLSRLFMQQIIIEDSELKLANSLKRECQYVCWYACVGMHGQITGHTA